MKKHFELSVKLNGTHFFSVSDKSITNQFSLRQVALQLVKRFDREDGFEITIHEFQGRELNVNELLKHVI